MTDDVESPGNVPGLVGLNNLGNTCFMNSALQCLSHVTPLTRYFLSHSYLPDLNESNPLGTGGKLATTYAELLKELWMRNTTMSVSPTALKRAIALYAPRFAGYLQHDAQEFLAYLLDGLHEDLNRTEKARYVEFPDVNGGENMAVAGAQAWEAHLRRNDSFVLDTAYGQFQSTCICPNCHRTSVSFDVFNHISLEIPRTPKSRKSIPVIVFRKPTRGKDVHTRPLQHVRPRRYCVKVNRDCSVAEFKQVLGDVTGIPPANLILAEISEHSITDVFSGRDEAKKVPIIGSRGYTAAYEIEHPVYEDSRSKRALYGLVTQFLSFRNKEGKVELSKFGFPILTALDPQASCRETWNRLWFGVDALVRKPGARRHIDFVDEQSQVRRYQLLSIHVVSNDGTPTLTFSKADGTKTSLLPHDSDEIMVSFFEELQGQFLFLAFEWRNPEYQESEISAPSRVVCPKSFVAFEDDSSMVEALKEEAANKKYRQSVTLDECFNMFTKAERLDENNMWYCSQCKQHVRAMKTMKLWRLPNILIVHLKRFEIKNAIRHEKLDTMVEFPVLGLDMSKYCSGTHWANRSEFDSMVDGSVDATYDLFGVVNHFGRMGFGHYTSFCSQWDDEGISSQWHLFDDFQVKAAKSSDVSSPAAYILFYRRRQFH